jgi:putative effector of murein hydrolase
VWLQRNSIRRSFVPLILALILGSTASVIVALGLGIYFGFDEVLLLSLVPKSVTAPVAMGIAEDIGGLPSLAAGLCIATGIMGGIFVTPVLNLFKVRDWRARGLAAGVASHGIGTARAFQVNEIAGVYSSIGMALNALATALMVGLVLAF